jgi:large subunit ribosomal protein L13
MIPVEIDLEELDPLFPGDRSGPEPAAGADHRCTDGGKYMKTYVPGAADIEKKWYVVDATDMTLGRLASAVATVLRGKNKPYFTPFMDTGDYVIIVNAEKIKVTGKKLDQKIYFRHSEYVGSAKYTTLREMLRTKPIKVVEHAVRGMLPKGRLGDDMYRKLHVYEGPEHKHAAQKPEELKF